MTATGKLDRPGGSRHFEIIDATPPWAGEAPLIVFHHGIGIVGSEREVFADARHGLPRSPGAGCGRALRACLDRRAA